MIELKIGMATADGSLRILDEDRLCYQVLSQTHSAKGVRTISKMLLSEWVEAVKNHPECGAGELRSMLCGKTEVDKFEYGYFATLKKMSEMILGRVEVVIPEADFSKEFVAWFAENRGKGKGTTAEKYLGYFKTLTSAYQEPTHSYWHGLYRVMHGKDAEKNVAAIGALEDFERIYGGVIMALEQKVKGAGMTDDGFAKAVAWFWRPEVKPHTCVTSALKAYREFLEWREKQTKSESAEEPAEVDRLTVALKLFKGARKATVLADVRYWIFSPGEQACRWSEMREGGVMSLSYSECGRDLREYKDEEAIRAEFKSSENDEASYKNHVRALTDFLNVMKPGDLVFAKKGTKTFLGVGRVTGEYEFAADAPDYKHRRTVEWLKADTVERDDAVARKTLTDITRYDDLVRELCEAYGIADFGLSGWMSSSAYWELNPGARQYFDELRKNIDNLNEDKVVEMFIGVKKNDKVVFKPMWSGSYGTGWNSLKRGLEEENSKTIETIRRYCMSAADLAVFATKEDGKNRPLGFGNSVVSELLMKFHPDVAMKCGRKTIAVYHDLQLMEFKHANDYSATEYTKALGIAADIRHRMDQFGVTRMVEGKEPADYLTVNEFIAWCGDHKDLIKETVMANKYKPTEIKKVEQQEIGDFSKFIEQLEKEVAEAGLKYAHGLMKRFVCAQLAKPFVVLTGLSGSGKTKLAEAFTKWIGVENTVNIVPVGADWTNNEKLLGYPNALDPDNYVMPDTGVLKLMLDANENQDLPFFLILDEMNLSHVERYFADFLSTMESHDGIIELYDSGKRYAEDGREIPPSFRFPKNLFVIGTMNVDETTYMFSPKVLDRAQVIEFRVSEKDMTDFLTTPGNPKIDDLAGKGAVYANAFLDLAKERKTKQPTGEELTKVKNALAAVFPPLAELGAEFGYRSAIEILTFVAYYLEASGYDKITDTADKEGCLRKAIDAGMLQKLLPKLHGSLNRLGPVIEALIGKVSTSKPLSEGSEANPEIEKTYPLTYEKLQRMKHRVEKNGFTSFAEA